MCTTLFSLMEERRPGQTVSRMTEKEYTYGDKDVIFIGAETPRFLRFLKKGKSDLECLALIALLSI